MTAKRIFTDLGDLAGQSGKYTRVRLAERGLELFDVRDIEWDRCCAEKTADQEILTTTWTTLSFDAEHYDVGDMHDNVTNNSRITIQTAGWYRVNYHIKHEAQDKAKYESMIRKNGSSTLEGTCDTGFGSKDASTGTLGNHSHLIEFDAEDYLELRFYHDKDVAQNILLANTFFEITREF